MTFYCGIDLHSKKSHVCIIDKNGKKVKEENLNNDLTLILQFLKPFGKNVQIAIESTINWYWIVDGLQKEGSQSSDKVKRSKGSKQGNHYLKFAFTQAASLGVRHYPKLRKFRDKHANRRKGKVATLVANCILAHKIANATFHMMKEGIPFDEAKLFG